MTAPALDTFASRIYEALEPYAYADHAYALAHLCQAIGRMWQPVTGLVEGTDAYPGWEAALRPDEAPAEALDWLAQFVGVRRSPKGLADADFRLRIAETDGFRRGSPNAIEGAARQHLTGQKTVKLIERGYGVETYAQLAAFHPDYEAVETAYGDYDTLMSGSAYLLLLVTYAAETPDPDAVERAVRAQKPAGIVLVYEVRDGQDYAEVLADHTDYDDVAASYPGYVALRDLIPS